MILLELSFLLFLLCSWSAIAFCSGWLEGNAGKEKSGRRNTVGRNWGIKGRITGIRPQFLDMLKRLPQQCHLVPCLYLFGWDHFKSLEKECTSGTSLGLCIAVITAEKAIPVMETAIGNCPVSAVYVQSVYCFGHFTALTSHMLSNTSPEMPPKGIGMSLFPLLIF